MTIAVPISWPTTMIPTVAWRPMSETLEIDRSSPFVSTSTTNLPLLNWSIHDSAAPSSDGTLRASSLPIRTALAWTCFWMLLRRERIEQRRPRLGHGRLAQVDVERQRARRLLGLDDGLHRERQLAVEPQAVVEDGAEERSERPAQRGRLAVDQVLPGEPVDVVP